MLPGKTINQLRAEEAARARRRVIGRIVAYALLGLLAVIAVTLFVQRRAISLAYRNGDELARGREWAVRMDSSDDVLAYILEHQADVSIAAWDVGHHADGAFLSPDEPRPVASMAKIQILAAYAAAVARGELKDDAQVDVAAWDAHYVERADDGSHLEALHALSLEPGAAGRVRLREIVHAMIRYSDDTAADYLLDRLGRTTVDGLPRSLGLTLAEDPPHPLVGELLVWNSPFSEPPAQRLERLGALPPGGYADAVWRASKALSTAEDPDARAFRAEGTDLTLREQEEFAAKLGGRGTAEGYAYLMQRIARRELAGADTLYDELSWSMKSGTIHDQFDEFGSKAGNLPGVLTAAYFARPRGGRLKVLAVLLSNLPGALWISMSQRQVLGTFARRMLLDDGFAAKVKSKLHAAAAGDAGLDASDDAAVDAGPIINPFDAAEPTLEQLADEDAGPLDEPTSPSPPKSPKGRRAPRR